MKNRTAVAGVQLAHATTGIPAADGMPLVLVHGFMGNARTWAPVLPALAEQREIVAYDHRGHGDSENTGPYTFDQLLADFAGLVDALALTKFHVLGHSMGGIVAMRYALAHRDRVASLIAMDTGAAPSPSDDPNTGFMRFGVEVARAQGMTALFDLIDAAIPATVEFDALRDQLRHDLHAMDPEAFAALGTELLEYPSFLDRLSALDVPTTVLVGENDTGLRPAADALAATIPHAQLTVIPDAAHNPHQENTDAWLAAVAAHFARL